MAGLALRMSRTRSANLGVLAEPLEPRLCLSFAISAYFPLSGGQTWNYSGSGDGFTGTATMSADAGVIEGGVSTTRLRIQFHDVNGTFTNSRFWNLGPSGLKLLREDHAQYAQTDRYPNGGLLVATPSFDSGQVVPYSALATSSSSSGTSQQNVQGTVTFTGEEVVVTPAGRFNAIRLIQSGTANIVGSTAHGTRTETQWLVKGVGIVQLQYDETDYYPNGTQSTYTSFLSLTGSSFLRPVIALSGSNLAISNGDTTPTTADGSKFGSVNALDGTQVHTFTITNNGTQTLNFGNTSAITLSGVNANRFVVLVQPSGALAPGASTQFGVRFTPGGQIGQFNATVRIASSDPATPNYTFAVQGTGLALPRAQVSGNRLVIANADTTPTTADWTKFAGVDALYGNKVRIFTITNNGPSALSLGNSSVTISGSNADRFLVFVQPAASLAPGASTQFRVRFTPGGQVGFANATISIASNDPATPSYTYAIQGNGLALPRAQVSGGGIVIVTGDTTPDPTDKTDFGSVAAPGSNNRVRLFTLTNTGLASLTLTGLSFVTIAGPNASDFIVSAQPTTGILAPGQSVTFKVRFDPTHLGPCNATVVLGTNENVNLSPSAGHYSLAIAGVGA